VKQIVDLLLVRDREQLATQALDLVLTDSAKTFLVRNGYDRELGARPLRRAIQRYLEDPLAEQVLLGEYPSGTTIVVDTDPAGEELVFEMVDTPDIPPVDLVDSGS
ncbi:MAG: NDP-hexose 4-ketoreductase, partial [bacterium]|nr:NDP-hexose 4-ketoreductase [bacterium]